MMTMVGDAYAAPLVEELRNGSYDLSSMFAIGTGGAATNPKHQRALLELLPQITLINGYGSSETGNVGFGRSQRGTEKRHVRVARGRAGPFRGLQPVPAARRARRSASSHGPAESRLAISTMRPPPARHFPSVDGQRVVISGDRGVARRPTARCSCSAAIRWSSTPVARRCSSRRSRKSCGRTRPSPTRWWWAGRVNAGARKSSPWSRCATVPSRPRAAFTRTARRSWRGSRRPKEFIFVEQVRRLGNGKAGLPVGEEQAAVQQESMT